MVPGLDSCDRSCDAASAFGTGFFTSVDGFTRVFSAADALASPAVELVDVARLEAAADEEPSVGEDAALDVAAEVAPEVGADGD